MDSAFALVVTKIAASCWLAYLAVRALVEIASRRPRTIYFPLITLFFFFGVPMAFDVFVGLPEYDFFPTVKVAANDIPTSFLYCMTVSTAAAVMWIGRSRHSPRWLQQTGFARLRLKRYLRAAAYAALFSPLLALLTSAEPRLYLSYGAILINEIDPFFEAGHFLVALATMLSLVAYCVLMLSAPRLLPTFFATLPFVVAAAWLNGKRYFVAYVLVAIVYVLWRRGLATGRRLALFMVLFAVFMAAFSQLYQSAVRNISSATISASELYDAVRFDYGRDHVVKLALFSELNPERPPVLEYRGQSLLFLLTMYVPRDFWPEKPLPYAQYVTSAAIGAPAQMWGWGLTTSILDEAIANIGLLGILLGPLALVVICRLGDAARSQLVGLLTGPIACALLVVEVPAFGAVFVAWAAAVAWEHRPWRRRRPSHEHLEMVAARGAIRSDTQVAGSSLDTR
jgi:hypothetical protein